MEVTTKMRIGDPVWLRGAKKGGEPFELGQVTNVQQNGARVTVADASGAERAFDAANADVFPANPAGSTAPDHCGLIHLNEPSILENSRARYASDDIYTYTGKILIALNPFANLSSIYRRGPSHHRHSKRAFMHLRTAVPPHRDACSAERRRRPARRQLPDCATIRARRCELRRAASTTWRTRHHSCAQTIAPSRTPGPRSEETMAKYKDKDVGARGAEPHVYAMGEAAYKHVKRNKTPAAIIMSGALTAERVGVGRPCELGGRRRPCLERSRERGDERAREGRVREGRERVPPWGGGPRAVPRDAGESGAGKTETTKHIMRYLAWRSESVRASRLAAASAAQSQQQQSSCSSLIRSRLSRSGTITARRGARLAVSPVGSATAASAHHDLVGVGSTTHLPPLPPLPVAR